LLIKDAKEIDEDIDVETKIFLPAMEIQIKREGKFSEVAIEVVKYWRNRAKKLNKIRSQVAGLMQLQMVKSSCDYCKRNWGLRSECVASLEDLFRKFLKRNKYENVYDISKWQSYFYNHAVLRTICFFCSEEILENRKNLQIEKFEKVEKRKNSIIKKVSLDTECKTKNYQGILKFWLSLAQRNLEMKNIELKKTSQL